MTKYLVASARVLRLYKQEGICYPIYMVLFEIFLLIVCGALLTVVGAVAFAALAVIGGILYLIGYGIVAGPYLFMEFFDPNSSEKIRRGREDRYRKQAKERVRRSRQPIDKQSQVW